MLGVLTGEKREIRGKNDETDGLEEKGQVI